MANSLIALWNRNATFKPLLESRVILYVLFFISLFTLFGYSQQGEYCGALIFLLVGFLTTFFSKNMIVVLFLALAVSSVIYRGVKVYKAEGFETGDDPMDLAESMENVMKQNLMGAPTTTAPPQLRPSTWIQLCLTLTLGDSPDKTNSVLKSRPTSCGNPYRLVTQSMRLNIPKKGLENWPTRTGRKQTFPSAINIAGRWDYWLSLSPPKCA